MSTSYGYGCLDCGTADIIGSTSYYSIPTLREMLVHVDTILAASAITGIDIQSDCGWYNLLPALEFAQEHRKQGHRIDIFDEYGSAVDECGEQTKCACCDHTDFCKLKKDHEGDHSPKRAE